MDLASIRITTEDLDATIAFYEQITGVKAERPLPIFAEITLSHGTIAIGPSQLPAEDPARSAQGPSSTTIEFHVADVDADYARLRDVVTDWVREPATMPWGNRSMLFRDPHGNLINFFQPVSEQAIEKFQKTAPVPA
jgi:predicted enzyme related to lactoylglutathione lyase